MPSVADDLRLASMSAVARLSPADRIALAFRLGDEDLVLYCAAHATSESDARAVFRRVRNIGRVRSRSNDPDSR